MGASIRSLLRRAPAVTELPSLGAALAGQTLLRARAKVGAGLVRSESPVIVAGMHRSGTSIVAEMLERAGMDVGGEAVDEHHEWAQFSRANRAMIGEGAFLLHDYGWTAPKTMEFIEARRGYAERTARWVTSGLAKRATRVWGWKDPRNCLTLPVWLSIYPKARVLHIIRDGRAVALSLADRDSLDPDFGLSLWALHVERTEEALLTVRHERQHTIRYEDLMAMPEETLRGLFEFAGLPLDLVDEIARTADSSRVGARREDPRTARFGQHPLLGRYGYRQAPRLTERSRAVNAR